VRARDADRLGAGVRAGHVRAQARERLRQQPAAAADVQHRQARQRRRLRRVAPARRARGDRGSAGALPAWPWPGASGERSCETYEVLKRWAERARDRASARHVGVQGARLRISQMASRMKATRTGLSSCSGLKLPLGSHHSAATLPNLCTSASTIEGPAAPPDLRSTVPHHACRCTRAAVPAMLNLSPEHLWHSDGQGNSVRHRHLPLLWPL